MNIPLILSALVALCLFSINSIAYVPIFAVVFLAVVVLSFLGKTKVKSSFTPVSVISSVILAFLIEVLGFNNFITAWVPGGDKLLTLLDTLSFNIPLNYLLAGMVLCVLSFYALFVLSQHIVNLLTSVAERYIPQQKDSHTPSGLKSNWFFVISAMALYVLMVINTVTYFVGMLITFGVLLLFASKAPSLWSVIREDKPAKKVFCILSAMGICLVNQSRFYDLLVKFGLPEKFNIVFAAVSLAGAFLALAFVYVCLSLFWKTLVGVFKDCEIFKGVKLSETIVYAVLAVLVCTYITVAFVQTDAFYGTEYNYDIVYTCDSPLLVKFGAYSVVSHVENDLRQPFFALFSAPFIGIANLPGYFFSDTVNAILLAVAQVPLLFCANFILAKMLELKPLGRVCFMLVSLCTYTQLLFALMLEQYVVAYFWLVLCMYMIYSKKTLSRKFVLFGTTGTLLTGAVLFPFAAENSPVKKFRAFIAEAVTFACEFVVMLLMFCRSDVITGFVHKTIALSRFTGQEVTFLDKVFQYTEFLHNCFLPAKAGASNVIPEHISWQLDNLTGLNIFGICIFALAAISAVLNRDKVSSRLAAFWAGFSVVMLLVLGWGTQENGLILYSLYFGWAFLVLIIQLVEKIQTLLKAKFILPAFCVAASAVLLFLNIPAMQELISFGTQYFPI